MDHARKDAIKELLLFESTHTEPGKMTSLKDYAGRMKEGQDSIYYISGSSRAELENSPYLESIKEKEFEVLYLLDEIDDFIAPDLEYSGKKIKSVVKGDIQIDDKKDSERKDAEKKYDKLLDFLKDELKEDVREVRFSGRLTDSVCCLVAGEEDMDPNMERLLKAMGQKVTDQKRILEINPSHPLVESMSRIFENNKTSPALKDYAKLLFEQALVLEGAKPKDPIGLAKIMSRLMVEHSTRYEK